MRISPSNFIKFGANLRELRLHLCQTGNESKGVREFVYKHYADLKMKNPDVPILVRECTGVQPRLWARYGKGTEKSVSLTNASIEDVFKHVQGHATANF